MALMEDIRLPGLHCAKVSLQKLLTYKNNCVRHLHCRSQSAELNEVSFFRGECLKAQVSVLYCQGDHQM